MRTPIVVLAGSLLVACSSGTRIVYVPAPATTPAPATSPVRKTPPPPPPQAAAPAPMPPVGVTIVRAEDRRIFLSTNQPAYVALFDIEPYRGVTLVYPASPAHRQVAIAGSSWLSISERSWTRMDDRDPRGIRASNGTRHLYAIASERPLRLSGAAFDDDGLRGLLGARAYRAADPYETMSALARQFVPPVAAEDWGEDVYTIEARRVGPPARVSRIYCPDGSVTYVRDDLADRAVCPWRGRTAGAQNAPAPRPDSVVASNGTRVGSRMEPGPLRVFRIPAPTPTPTPVNPKYDPPRNGGENVADGRHGDDRDDHHDNGNHYGRDGVSRGNNGNGNNGNNGNNAEHGVQQQGSGDRPNNGQKPEQKPENKPENKPDEKSDRNNDEKNDKKPNEKSDEKSDKPKPRQKTAAEVLEQMRAHARGDTSDTSTKGKP